MVVSTIMYKSLSVYIISDIYCLCFLFAVTIPSIGEQSKCPRTSNNVCLINRKWNFTELRVFYWHNLTYVSGKVLCRLGFLKKRLAQKLCFLSKC